MDFDRLLALLRAFREHSVEYVLVGAAALNVQGIVRATEDVDVFVRPTAENVDRLRWALRSVWDDPAIDQITVEDLAGDYPTVRYGPPGGSLTIDILARLGSTFRFEDLEAETLPIEGVPVRVATPRTLYRMKKDTIRPQDRADAATLREKFHLTEE
jgi:hypothetical protein